MGGTCFCMFGRAEARPSTGNPVSRAERMSAKSAPWWTESLTSLKIALEELIGTTQRCVAMAGKRKTTDQDLRAEILRLIQEPKYRPLDKIEIAHALGYSAAAVLLFSPALLE